jgi:hypothetical protein
MPRKCVLYAKNMQTQTIELFTRIPENLFVGELYGDVVSHKS